MSPTETAGDRVDSAAVPPDPIYQKSYSLQIALASVAVVGAVALAIADEVWLRRPYRATQAEFRAAALAYLDRLDAEKVSFEEALRGLDEFKALDAAVARAVRESEADRLAAQNDFEQQSALATALAAVLKIPRSEIAALTYDAEHATHESGEHEALATGAAAPFLTAIAKVEAEPLAFTWVKVTRTAVDVTDDEGQPVLGADGQPTRRDVTTEENVSEKGTVAELNARFAALQKTKGEAQKKVGDAKVPVDAAVRAREKWLAANLGSIKRFLGTGRTTEYPDATGSVTVDALRQRVADKVAEVGVKRYLDEYVAAVPPKVVASVRKSIQDMPHGALGEVLWGGQIQEFQIHVKDTNNWVDRCEVCHLGTRSVVPMSEESLREAVTAAGWSEDRIETADLRLFQSHPRAAELFAKHDPEKFGCSTCHNGNGIAVTSAFAAHGENEDWIWPLHPKENVEAGCVQCHQKDVYLDGGPRISKARETFMDKGCWGCHPYDGYDQPAADIVVVQGAISGLEREQEAKRHRIQSLDDLARSWDVPDDDDGTAAKTSDRLFAESNTEKAKLTVEIAQLQTEIDLQRRRLRGLHDEKEKVGPNLKEVKAGVKKEILTPWIQDPTHVRPDTKMPAFRWWGGMDEATGLDEDAKDAAAFIWQSALDPAQFPEMRLTAPRGGSAGRGKQLFQSASVGCLGCHGVEEDGKLVGNDFAANLSVVGEKKTYEWIYRWVRDPRHRLVPYSVKEKRDLTKAEWQKLDPKEQADTLVWAMPTRMPNLRLSEDDARDIATYLSGLGKDRKWPEPTWLEDKARAAHGREVVLTAGCAGCHEIAGLEDERGIGTDLTKEGSKALERLDFGHLTTEAKRGHDPLVDWETTDGVKIFAEPEGPSHLPREEGWYRPRAYFMHKLAKPDLYDSAKYFADRTLRSRMPQFRLTAQQIHDLTTFLLGSVDTRIPASSRYAPDDRGEAVREGWWVVKKYNCEGCHEIEPGQVPAFRKLPWLTSSDLKPDGILPPTLVGVGFRLRPEFIADFLRDPSLGGDRARPKSVRRHLDVRMPTFHMTEEEIAKLVRFFGAMAKQPPVYQPPRVDPLTAGQRAAADTIWKAANCLQCHVIGDTTPPTTETRAPDLVYAWRRLRPEWMHRWIPRPQERMNPATSMTNNFERERSVDGRPDETSRWVYVDRALPALQGVTEDHVDLMVRYVHGLGAPGR